MSRRRHDGNGQDLSRPVLVELRRSVLRSGHGSCGILEGRSVGDGRWDRCANRVGDRRRRTSLYVFGRLVRNRCSVRKCNNRSVGYCYVRSYSGGCLFTGSFPSHPSILLGSRIYCTVGTTIGYGDATPKSDLGKVAVAVYAILVVNVVATLLQPGRRYLERLCRVPSAKRRAEGKQD